MCNAILDAESIGMIWLRNGGETMNNEAEMLLVFGVVWIALFVFFYSRIAGNKFKTKQDKS